MCPKCARIAKQTLIIRVPKRSTPFTKTRLLGLLYSFHIPGQLGYLHLANMFRIEISA